MTGIPFTMSTMTEAGKTILVVDDHVDTAKPLARMLNLFGHRGVYRTSGEEALNFLEEHSCDLMLLDVMMPGIDGMEVLRLVRSNPRIASLPVVMFSAVSDPQFRSFAMSRGANDFWIKASIDFDELRERVNRMFRDDSANASPKPDENAGLPHA